MGRRQGLLYDRLDDMAGLVKCSMMFFKARYRQALKPIRGVRRLCSSRRSTSLLVVANNEAPFFTDVPEPLWLGASEPERPSWKKREARPIQLQGVARRSQGSSPRCTLGRIP